MTMINFEEQLAESELDYQSIRRAAYNKMHRGGRQRPPIGPIPSIQPKKRRLEGCFEGFGPY